MATHSSVLPWRIPWTEEPGRLQSKKKKKLNMTEQTPQRMKCREGVQFPCFACGYPLFFLFLEHILFLELGKMLNFNITLKVVINSSGS